MRTSTCCLQLAGEPEPPWCSAENQNHHQKPGPCSTESSHGSVVDRCRQHVSGPRYWSGVVLLCWSSLGSGAGLHVQNSTFVPSHLLCLWLRG